MEARAIIRTFVVEPDLDDAPARRNKAEPRLLHRRSPFDNPRPSTVYEGEADVPLFPESESIKGFSGRSR